MGEIKGFLEYPRQALKKQPVHERVKHYKEFVTPFEDKGLRSQGARCMDCGVAFCHNACPLGNLIPSWNQLVTEEQFKAALELLLSTNNFPEFTGRICPAPCESACVLGINDDPVAIEGIEMALADMGFAKGWIKAEVPLYRSGKKVAVIGSGPSGLAAAQQLNRAGHSVVVYE
ncbi:MAG: glutamate synthase, partial [Proteobacteria bacterium]